MQIGTARCTVILRPIPTLTAMEGPSCTTKSAHVSVESTTQPTTTFSILGSSEVAQAALLQRVQVPAESVCFVRLVNPWPHCAICFEPSPMLPLCLCSSSTLINGPSVWIAVQNLWFKPVTLHAGHKVGTMDVVEVLKPDEAAVSHAPCRWVG